MTQDLLESLNDGVAVLTMNRPDRLNALSGEMLDALLEALPRLANDPSVGAVVLTGAGRGFCAGGDVKAMAEGRELPGDTLEERAQGLRDKMETSRLLHEMPKPTIAMIHGAAAGAGLCLAAACDFRIAAEDAVFTTAFVKVGFSGDYGGTYLLSRLLGGAKARELYFLGDKIDAAEALRIGLVGKVVSVDALEGETMSLARRLAKGPRVAHRHMKRALVAAETMTGAQGRTVDAIPHDRLRAVMQKYAGR